MKKINWHSPQEIYYYAYNNTGFKPRPFRSQGTFQKYSSIDDKIDDLHFYTQFIKFGFGRATVDSCIEIRRGSMEREQALSLIKIYDGKFPYEFLQLYLDYFKMNKKKFIKVLFKHTDKSLFRIKNDKIIPKVDLA